MGLRTNSLRRRHGGVHHYILTALLLAAVFIIGVVITKRPKAIPPIPTTAPATLPTTAPATRTAATVRTFIDVVRANYPRYYATYMQYAVALDLRDLPREPTRGAYFALTVQHAGYFLPSDWDYFRVTPDVRGYFPLGFGMVLAARARFGIMEIGDSSIAIPADDTFDVNRRLRELGPDVLTR